MAGGAFDFREEKLVGRDIVSRDIVSRDEQLYLAKGYDHCFILQKNRAGALSHAATLRDPASKRTLKVYTTQPGMLLYTGNRITGAEPAGKGGEAYHETTVFKAGWPVPE